MGRKAHVDNPCPHCGKSGLAIAYNAAWCYPNKPATIFHCSDDQKCRTAWRVAWGVKGEAGKQKNGKRVVIDWVDRVSDRAKQTKKKTTKKTTKKVTKRKKKTTGG